MAKYICQASDNFIFSTARALCSAAKWEPLATVFTIDTSQLSIEQVAENIANWVITA